MAKKGKSTKLGELPRTGPEVAQASMVISALMMTPDDGYDKFRSRRAANRTLELAHLARARDMLDAIAEAVTSGDEQKERWRRLELGWRALFETEPAAPVAAAPPVPQPAAAPLPPVPEPAAARPPEPIPAAPAVVPLPPAALPAPPAMVPQPALVPLVPPPVTAPAVVVPSGRAGLPAHAQAALAALERAELGTAGPLSLNQTLPIGEEAPHLSPLPFVGGMFVPGPAAAAEVPPSVRVTGTLEAAQPRAARAHKPPTLPFARPPTASEQPPVAPGAAAITANPNPAGRASPSSAQRMMGATTEVDSDAAVDPSKLPFVQAVRLASARAAAAAKSGPTAPPDAAGRAARASAPPPTALPSGARPSAPPPAQAESPVAPLPPHLARLSVEQFATYCAHCAASPDNMAAIEQRYGIGGPAERAALERHWHGRLSQDPTLLAAWREHLMRAKSFFTKR